MLFGDISNLTEPPVYLDIDSFIEIVEIKRSFMGIPLPSNVLYKVNNELALRALKFHKRFNLTLNLFSSKEFKEGDEDFLHQKLKDNNVIYHKLILGKESSYFTNIIHVEILSNNADFISSVNSSHARLIDDSITFR